MTYTELLKEHAAAEGITMLNSFGHGMILDKGKWFDPDQFRGDAEVMSEIMCDVITGPSREMSFEEL